MRILNFRDRRPLTRLELVLVILVACLTGLAVLHRVERLAAEGESTAMLLTVRALQHGVTSQALKYILAGDAAALADMPGSNPMLYVDPPDIYLGEFSSTDRPRKAGRAWFFDPDSEKLVYLAEHTRYFFSESDDGKSASFAIHPPSLQGEALPKLTSLNRFQWF